MIKEAIEHVFKLGMGENPIVEMYGVNYDKGCRRIVPPTPDQLSKLESLSGFLSYLESPDFAGFDRTNTQIVVNSYRELELVGVPESPHYIRCRFISAKCPIKHFEFHRFFDPEQFIINLQSQFCDNDDKNELLKLVSSITDDTAVTTEDDGVSQAVVVEKKFRKNNAVVRPFWDLRPHRTFPEVMQPESRFLLRVRKGPEVALYEADGGMWRVQATNSVVDYIRSDSRVTELGLAVIG